MVRYYTLEHELHSGAMDYTAGGNCFTTHWDQATEVESKVRQLLFPWLPREDRGTIAKRMSKEWEKQFGAYSDPETQRKLRATIEFLHRTAREGREKGRGLAGRALLGVS